MNLRSFALHKLGKFHQRCAEGHVDALQHIHLPGAAVALVMVADELAVPGDPAYHRLLDGLVLACNHVPPADSAHLRVPVILQQPAGPILPGHRIVINEGDNIA
ncbi:hypothetical protein D3C75_849640 [compost metagenome]